MGFIEQFQDRVVGLDTAPLIYFIKFQRMMCRLKLRK